jgi:hypothetical protein
LHFYRGWFCPKERAYFAKPVRFQEEMEVACSRLVSVSVEPFETQAACRAGLGARWTFLSDSGRGYIDELGLLETSDSVHRPYSLAVFTPYPDLIIHRAYNGYWFWGRPTNEELRWDLRQITRVTRLDWEVVLVRLRRQGPRWGAGSFLGVRSRRAAVGDPSGRGPPSNGADRGRCASTAG